MCPYLDQHMAHKALCAITYKHAEWSAKAESEAQESAKWVLWPAGNSVSCGNNGRCQDWHRDTFSDCCF